MNVTWWCSAGSGPWTWAPQWYPGIWAFMLALLVAYAMGISRLPREARTSRAEGLSFAAGYLLLWLALDWPLGALGAGYLLAAHTSQYVLISLVAVPLLLHGMPRALRSALLAPRAMAPARWLAGRPFAAFVFFNVVMLGTHLPVVADALKPLQFGSMAIDLLWIAAAFLFWLAIDTRYSADTLDIAFGRRMLYTVAIKILPIVLGGFFVLSDFPIYSTYELAVRAVDLSARHDQALAGWLIWAGTTPIIVFRLATAFIAWHELDSQSVTEL